MKYKIRAGSVIVKPLKRNRIKTKLQKEEREIKRERVAVR